MDRITVGPILACLTDELKDVFIMRGNSKPNVFNGDVTTVQSTMEKCDRDARRVLTDVARDEDTDIVTIESRVTKQDGTWCTYLEYVVDCLDGSTWTSYYSIQRIKILSQ